mmetsp:Transcript_45941/g.98199  ORF Transcript_45941/g.98199 Transcript_45941/m.98199 type:complete len:271 (-) Transcript_45941:167-979(-)
MSLKRHLPPLAPGPAALPVRSPGLPRAGTLRGVTQRGACPVGLPHRLVLVGLLPDSRLLFVPQADTLIMVALVLPDLSPLPLLDPLLQALTLLLAVGGELPLLEVADQFLVKLADAGGALLRMLFHTNDMVSRPRRPTAGRAGTRHFGARHCQRQDVGDHLHRGGQHWHHRMREDEWRRRKLKRQAAEMTSKGHRRSVEDNLALDRETFWLILPLGVLRLEGLLEHLAAITEDQVVISRLEPRCLSVVGASTLRTSAGRGGGPRVRFLGL